MNLVSVMGSIGGNDNGNTEPEPALNVVGVDSNDVLTSNGTLFGEPTIPSKFLSAKNSIEIHKNKVLSSNQSLPNVASERMHCLNSLISSNRDGSSFRSLFSPLGKPAGGIEEHAARISNSGQKSAKSVNWAPVLPGQTTDVTPTEAMISPQTQTSTANLISLSEAPQNAPPAELVLDQHQPPEKANHTSIGTGPDHQGHFLHNDGNVKPLSDTESLTERENHVNIGGSAYDTGNCPSPTLPPTSISEYTFLTHTADDNYKSGCLFLPPAENYVYNAHVDLNSSEELIHNNDQYFNQNYPLGRRDQNVGSEMTALKAKDNNLDNHNYDTDDDLGDPDPQTPVLSLVNPKDLPVPDPEYVARIVSEELHPYIAKKYKKDCRMWLWKSRAQREAYLSRQRAEQEKKDW